jgi:hypothetical protein
MTRRLKLGLSVLAALLVMGGAVLWALPEIVRRAAVARIPKTLDREVRIEDVDLNLFTGRFAVTGLWLARRPGQGPEGFVEFERLEGRLALLSLLRSDIRLADLRLARPVVRVTRTGPVEFDFADLLQIFTRPVAKEAPSRWTFSLDRLEVADGAVLVKDAHLSPPEDWRLEGLGIEAAGLTTRPDQPPGRLRMGARLGEAGIRVGSESVYLAPFGVSLDVSLTDFDLARLRRYLPPDLPAVPETGKVGFALRMERVRAGEALAQSTVSGEVRVDGLSVVQRNRPAPFLTLAHLGIAIKQADFLARGVALAAIEVEGLDVKAARDRAGNVDLLAALGERGKPGAPAVAGTGAPSGPPSAPPGQAAAGEPRGPPAAPASPPAPPRVSLDRLTVRSATVKLDDQAVSPPRQWRIEGLMVDGQGLSTAGEDPPGTLEVQARLSAQPGGKPAAVQVHADSVRLVPLAASARISLTGFDLASVLPYLPDTLPARPTSGNLGLGLTASVEQGGSGLRRATASGSLRLADLAVTQRGAATPFLTLPTLAVSLRQADAIARSVSLAAVEMDGLDVRASRSPDGKIDLLGLMAPAPGPAAPVPAPAAPPPPSARAPAQAEASAGGAAPWRIALERFALTRGKAAFEDQAVAPVTTLALTDLTVTAARLTWPSTSHATFAASVTMPGSGRTEVKGSARLEPLDAQVSLTTRDASITPYEPYFPFAARFAGFFSGDSVNEIQRGADGKLVLASRGNARARDLEIRGPGAGPPVATLAQFEIRGIDFSWPNYALVDRVRLLRPEARIERDAEGRINLRELFTPRGAAAPSAPAPAVAAAKAEAPAETGAAARGPAAEGGGGLLQTMVLDFNEIALEEGFVRFLDRTTRPAFSQDLSRLALTIRDLSNVPGRRRTTMTAQAIVGGDAALDMRGELSGIGESLRADLIGELRDFALTSANPYADSLTSWVVQRGKLTARVRYRIEGDRLSAAHDVKFGGIQVEQSQASDEAKRRIGLPLGLVVALLKDSRGDIDFSLPLHGTLGDRSFDWGEAMWAAVKQVILKVLAAPFNAIGRLFRGGDDKVEGFEVRPVLFAAGSSVIAPTMETHLTRVADFLRRSPYVKLSLKGVVTREDEESLKADAVTARLQRFQREQGLADTTAALRVYFQQRVPDVTLPKTPDEQVALLRRREAAPQAALADLLRRRLEATRERLVQAEGIPGDRLVTAAAAPATGGSGEGRVEFDIVAGGG